MIKFKCNVCNTEWFVDEENKYDVKFCPYCTARLSSGSYIEEYFAQYDQYDWRSFDECYTVIKVNEENN